MKVICRPIAFKEKKICEAYSMLKGQGVIQEDPVHVKHAVFAASLPPREADLSVEESARLQKLLHSGNQQDLEKANQIIQSMVRKEEEKLEKATKQASQLQEVQASTRLLSDMLEQVEVGQVAAEDREIMAELYSACEGWRPKLFQLAAEAEENDPVIGDILYASDEMSRIIDKYKDLIILNKTNRSESSSNHNLLNIAPKPSSRQDLLEEFLLGQNGGDNPTSHIQLTAETFGAISLNQYGGHLLSDTASDNSSMLGVEDSQFVGEKDEISPLNNQIKNLDLHKMAENNLLMEENGNGGIKDIFSEFGLSENNCSSLPPVLQDLLSDGPDQQCSPNEFILPNLQTKGKISDELNQRRRGLDELDLLGENALRAQLPEHKEAGFIARKQEKLPLKELMRQSSSMSQFESQEQQTPPPYPTTPTNQTKPKSNQTCSSLETNQTNPKIEKPVPQALLTNNFDPAPKSEVKVTEVKLQDIKLRMEDVVPHPALPPLDLQAEGPVSLVLHYSCTVPAPGVSVHVVQFTNTGKLPVEELEFKAVVPKGCKVRLLPISSNHLPSPLPFSPSPTCNQLMLVLNPEKKNIFLGFVLSYSIDEESFTFIGKDIQTCIQ
ncbi:ADP-ribosylation factor-binding protein GGA1 isoform X5 [Eurytemora carolleeae]|uniref:ADP-ribosylation factor-binding protein GGA1 isoform X5 n=1 Tax=Eurytemora carolleeae TaxID=1294199 RepID=UPI000C75DB4D|nr:ADP-ribosylation factor-binding protein GGA1 isoform X5 [Eurytemora carolleeae]|eukprot:XP_023323999.1 ADP-ribosylation factor-binding protein GGA1-like isoform X5 [Eurytemora affinis]